jgi:hypothetical protein
MATIQQLQATVPRVREIAPRAALPWLLVTLGAVAWLATLRPVTPADLTDIGLLPALPAGWWLGVLLASLALVRSIAVSPVDTRAGAAAVLLLVAILYATPALVEALPRFNTVYVHLGFIETIERTGMLYPDMDARFSWPVFFTAMAAFTTITGVNLVDVAAWVPALTTLLVLPAAWLLVRAFTDDSRLSLVALWMLVLGNWVGQDYLSPQGYNFLLYTWVLALLAWFFGASRPRLGWLRSRLRRSIEPEPTTVAAPGAGGWARGSLVIVVAVLALFSVTSHQLTPFAMIAVSTGLVVLSRTTLRWMPLLIAIMTGVWIAFAGYSYLAGHLEPLLQDIGDPGGAAQAGVVARLQGSEGHGFVVRERIGFSLVVWGLAGIGVLRRLWAGHWDLAAGLLAAFPFGLIALQSYGGEIFLRVYLIALPAMAFFAAAAILPGRILRPWLAGVVLVVATMGLSAGFVVARYGNEIADVVTRAEVAAVDRMHELATPDTVMATLNYNSPIRYRNVERFDFFDIPSSAGTLAQVDVVGWLERYAQDRPALMLLSRGQLALEGLNGATDDEIAAFVARLDGTPGLEIAFRNEGGTVYRLVQGTQP